MELYFNELSGENEFASLEEFRNAFSALMSMRNKVLRFGRIVRCKSDLSQSKVLPGTSLVATFRNRDEKRAFFQWVSRYGARWDVEQHHEYGELMEENGVVVTESSVGEAAYRCHQGELSGLLSLATTSWERAPLSITWSRNAESTSLISVDNFWDTHVLVRALENAPRVVGSWTGLEERAQQQFPALSFANNAFEALNGHPFHPAASRSILAKLGVLQCLKEALREKQQARVNEILAQHFMGEKAWFSDSSVTEKRNFKQKLTFSHPETGAELFYPWHGKVKTPQIRIHFTYPVIDDSPLLIVYVGPKLTKR